MGDDRAKLLDAIRNDMEIAPDAVQKIMADDERRWAEMLAEDDRQIAEDAERARRRGSDGSTS